MERNNYSKVIIDSGLKLRGNAKHDNIIFTPNSILCPEGETKVPYQK